MMRTAMFEETDMTLIGYEARAPVRGNGTPMNAKSLLMTAACSWAPLADVLSRLFPHRDFASQATRWDQEYASGGWHWLKGLSEAPHNYVIAAYANRLKPDATILDVGCGEGVLHAILRTQGYERYTGIDLSPTAIENAAALADERTEFLVGDVRALQTERRFDVIILNEVLYYFPDPEVGLEELGRLLLGEGIFIVSMARAGLRDALAKQKIWRAIRRKYHLVEEVSLFYADGLPRTIAAFRPPPDQRRDH